MAIDNSIDCSQDLNPEIECLFACLSAVDFCGFVSLIASMKLSLDNFN
jgi:hypothetical protein